MGQIFFDLEFSNGKKIKLMDNGTILIIETKEAALSDLDAEESAEFVREMKRRGIK